MFFFLTGSIKYNFKVCTHYDWLVFSFYVYFFFYSTMGTTVIDLQSFVFVRKMQNSTTEIHNAL